MGLLKTVFYLILAVWYMTILHILMPIEFTLQFILCFLSIHETPRWLKRTRRFLYGPFYEIYQYYE
jgi:hypothetical protein